MTTIIDRRAIYERNIAHTRTMTYSAPHPAFYEGLRDFKVTASSPKPSITKPSTQKTAAQRLAALGGE